MARFNIIILEKIPNESEYSYLFWADVPVAKQPFYAKEGFKSEWRDALASDNLQFQTGAWVEQKGTIKVPSGATLAQIENYLQTKWQNFQDSINSTTQFQRYGSTWDGSAWVITNIL